jgi:hypothetical protein
MPALGRPDNAPTFSRDGLLGTGDNISMETYDFQDRLKGIKRKCWRKKRHFRVAD